MSRARLWIIVVAVVLVIAGLGASLVFLWGVYNRHWEGTFSRRVANALPIPAGKVGSHSVLLRDYYAGLDSMQTYLASDQAASQNERRPMVDSDRKNVLERLLQEQALNELAATRKITVTDDQMNAVLAELNVSATSTADFQDFISKNYGWSMDDFKQHVVHPLVLTRLLTTAYASEHGGDTNAFGTYMDQRMQASDVVRYIKFQ